MKKFIFSLIAMFAIVISANAQYSVNGHKFFDNWSVGVEGGVQTNLHDWNSPQGAVAGLTLNKEITPVFGLTFQGNLGFNNTANWLHPQVHVHNGYAVDNVEAFALAHVNLMNWWGGYTGKPRVFEVVPFAGVGYGHGWYEVNDYLSNPETHKETNNDLLAKAGVNLDFNVGPARAWTISLKPAVVYGATKTHHGYGLDCRNAVAELTAGVTYHFGTSSGKHHYTRVELPDPIVKEVVKEVPVEVIVERELVKEVVVENTANVNKNQDSRFAQDQDAVDATAGGILDDLVEEMLGNDAEYLITGYASVDGDEAYNQELSEKRANAVLSYLVNHGVDANRLTAVGAGETSKFGEAYEPNRRVTVEKK